MNRLLHTLRDMDDCEVVRHNGTIRVWWFHPLHREQNRQLDIAATERLIAGKFLYWDEFDGLQPTARGWRLIRRYRPLSWSGYPVYPNYLNWLTNCRSFQRYIKEYGL